MSVVNEVGICTDVEGCTNADPSHRSMVSLSVAEIQQRTEDRIAGLEAQLAEMQKTLEDIQQVLVNADATITKISDEVKPTLDQVLASPMLRMLTGGKKK